jgi:hypothetical protein
MNSLIYDLIYFAIVLSLQVIINMFYVTNTCNKPLDQSIILSMMYTVIPWVVIFGCMIMLLGLFPEFKNVFGNIVGYYINNTKIINLAKKILNNDTENRNIISEMLFINEININDLLTLYTSNSVESLLQKYKEKNHMTELKDILFNKQLIGEIIWYLYTGIFNISLVGYLIEKNAC